MANKHLFSSAARAVPSADTHNAAGGKAYRFGNAHALAQYAATSCFGGVFYATEREQLDRVLGLCEHVDSTLIAKTAVYARERGLMKDMPALLLAVLATREDAPLEAVFDRVCDNAKMLRNFVQILRSGVTGRKSLGSRPKRLVQRWLDGRSDAAVFRATVGTDPSLADVIKMVHPTPGTASRRALYGWILGRPHDLSALPQLVRDYEAFKADLGKEVPDVPFQMLTHLALKPRHWMAIARAAGWQMTRMNLNTFMRQGVFHDRTLVDLVARRLSDPHEVRKARAFPYQLMAAYCNANAELPGRIREALHDAMEIAVSNVPRIEGRVWVLTDVSGSMHSPVTGHRRGATTKVRCIDVAALVAAAMLRTNHRTRVIPFHDRVQPCRLEPRDTVLTNAQRLATLPSGGTDCAAPLAHLNKEGARGDLVVFVSDNQSWIDRTRSWNPGTAVMREWAQYKRRNPAARLVCIDVQPYANTQAPEGRDILNVGGFSDAVFDVMAAFVQERLGPDHWVGEIERVTL